LGVATETMFVTAPETSTSGVDWMSVLCAGHLKSVANEGFCPRFAHFPVRKQFLAIQDKWVSTKDEVNEKQSAIIEHLCYARHGASVGENTQEAASIDILDGRLRGVDDGNCCHRRNSRE
jgi:hypothetical protein